MIDEMFLRIYGGILKITIKASIDKIPHQKGDSNEDVSFEGIQHVWDNIRIFKIHPNYKLCTLDICADSPQSNWGQQWFFHVKRHSKSSICQYLKLFGNFGETYTRMLIITQQDSELKPQHVF